MLDIIDLYASYQSMPILQGVNLTVKSNEIHLILGSNGSGKSTLGRCLLGDSQYTHISGDIIFCDNSFKTLSVTERVLKGFFLSFQLSPELDGVRTRDFLFSAQKSIDPTWKSAFRFNKKLKQIFKSLDLNEDFLERETNKGFSGGERKKMEMVTLLTLQPKLAFLDEIDSGVDIDTIIRIGNAMKQFLQQSDKAIILVSHSERLIKEVPPTHVHIFVNGAIQETGGKELIQHVHRDGFDKFMPKKYLEKTIKKGLRVL